MDFFSQPLEFSDYLQILKRRKWLLVVPSIVVIVIGTVLAFSLPAVYRSEATFVVQRQSIPSNFVATTVTGYVQEQIEQIRQRLVTHNNLVDIANQYNLYPELFSQDQRSLVLKLRDDIEVEMVDVQATDPDRSGVRLATVAFTVAFHGEAPDVTRDVTNDLADRFMLEHRRSREAGAANVSRFLEDEADRLRFEIEELEGELAGFKQEQLRQLPEMINLNMAQFEKTEARITFTEERIIALDERIDAILAELSLTEPYAVVRNEQGQALLSASERLSALTAEYTRASARYSSAHPDIVKLSREIRVLAEQTGKSGRMDEVMGQLVSMQEQLRQARQKYTADHPEVVQLEKSVAALQRGFQSALISDNDGPSGSAPPPDNPRYVALQTELDSKRVMRRLQSDELTNLQLRLAEYEERLQATPTVEKEYMALNRDHGNAVQKYTEVTGKLLQARMAEELESGDSGEKFLLTSSAYLPVLPDSPNRIGIILLAILFGLASGIGFVIVAEFNDRTIRGAQMLGLALGRSPLAVIPQFDSAYRR